MVAHNKITRRAVLATLGTTTAGSTIGSARRGNPQSEPGGKGNPQPRYQFAWHGCQRVTVRGASPHVDLIRVEIFDTSEWEPGDGLGCCRHYPEFIDPSLPMTIDSTDSPFGSESYVNRVDVYSDEGGGQTRLLSTERHPEWRPCNRGEEL